MIEKREYLTRKWHSGKSCIEWAASLSEMNLSWTFIWRGSQLLKVGAVSSRQKIQQARNSLKMGRGSVCWGKWGEYECVITSRKIRARLWPRGTHLSIIECEMGGCHRKSYFSNGERWCFVGTVFWCRSVITLQTMYHSWLRCCCLSQHKGATFMWNTTWMLF